MIAADLRQAGQTSPVFGGVMIRIKSEQPHAASSY
jgi:hypothetical protein